jgi:hypothetical protein
MLNIFNYLLLNLLFRQIIINALLTPVFPNNIVCFPERDFCTVEGYIDYTGQDLILNVLKDTIIMGSAKGKVSGDAVAFEVNHPGGLCWGDNTNLKVTPNIEIGDKIEIKKDALLLSEIIIKNGKIIKKEKNGNTIKVTGFLESNIDLNNIEVRIVNNDLKTTSIGRRDARAINGPVGPIFAGYLSGIDVTNNNLIAIFEFADSTAADMAFNSAYSLSMWETTDNAGNPLGITISEFEEIGGPWSLLCPTYANFINVNLKKLIIVNQILKWDKNIQLLPGSDPITGFSAHVIRNIDQNVNEVIGYRFSNFIDTYDFNKVSLTLSDKLEFRVMTNNKLSDPLLIELNNLNENPTIIFTPQANPIEIINTNVVSLSSNTGQIIYTLDDTIPSLDNGLIYTDSISITKETTIQAIAYSFGGKESNIISGKFAPEVILKTYLPPSNLVVRQQSNSLTVSWTNIDDPTINLYKINIYSNNILISSTDTTLNPLIITNLIPNIVYSFSILARYDTIWSSESIKSPEIKFPQLVDNIIITTSKWKSTDFRVSGTSSMPNAILTLYKANADNTISSLTINIQGTNTPISGTSSGLPDITNNYVFDIRVTKNQVPPNPSKYFIKSSKGGIAGPIIL